MLLPGAFQSVSDPMTGYFVLRRTALQDVLLAPCGYKILAELLVRLSFRNIVEVGYIFRSRERDQSKASVKVFLDYLRHLLRLRAALRKRDQHRDAAAGQ
jgi:dolichol-phosphate mannosyltransferase